MFAVARVLAHARPLVTQGIYAKLHDDDALRRALKTHLHHIDRGLDDQRFLRCHRLQLAEAERFVGVASGAQLDRVGRSAALIKTLGRHTAVPSALSVAREKP